MRAEHYLALEASEEEWTGRLETLAKERAAENDRAGQGALVCASLSRMREHRHRLVVEAWRRWERAVALRTAEEQAALAGAEAERAAKRTALAEMAGRWCALRQQRLAWALRRWARGAMAAAHGEETMRLQTQRTYPKAATGSR